jgi:alkylation response protein AidB-like acyl-CoA dehydrogenase
VKAWSRVEILRFLNYDTMTKLSRGLDPGAESSLKKEFWTRLVQHLHETILEVEGADAQLMPGDPRAVDDGAWQQTFLYSKSQSISGGTSEIQMNIMATRMLGLPKGS